MKTLVKLSCLFSLPVVLFSCEGLPTTMDNQKVIQEEFTTKTFGIQKEVTSKKKTKKGTKYKVFKDEDGILNARFQVIGNTKRAMEKATSEKDEETENAHAINDK